MKVSPSIDDQDLRSLVDDETISVIKEEEGMTGDDNTVKTKAPQAPHEDEVGALSPREETLALLQGVPKDLTHGDLDTTQEQHASSCQMMKS